MPILPQDSSSPLGDLFGGINRPQLNAFVAGSQAKNGLVSAQTQDAMIKAQQGQEELDAHAKLRDAYVSAGMKGSDADLATAISIGHFGDAPTALKAVAMAKLGYGTPEEQTSGQQMFHGTIAPPVAVPNTSIMPPGSGLSGAPVTQTPAGVAETGLHTAQANLAQAQANDPSAFHPKSGLGTVPPEQMAGLQQAVADGRLDPTRLNSRTAPIYAQMEASNPGQVNFNRLHADAALQSNAGFQQKAMSVDMLPGLLSHVTTLGKKLNGGAGYSDLKTVGQMQQFMNGQLNDPDYTEYMTARNDTLLRLAGVMRGVGMSDQAHTAEVQAMAPTLAPYALDAWLKGQMSVVNPLLERQNRITHLGEKGAGTTPLGDAAATGGKLPSYADEAAALAAGHKVGDRVMIGGVSGTLQ